MSLNYDLWIERHNECDEKVCRLCELEQSKESVKCNSAFCVMNHAMQDIQGYFKRNECSTAELCFLIRNIDVIITSVLDLNHILLGVGLNKTEKAIKKCFTDKEKICKFRILRSLILAHPVDTNYHNEDGETETVYLEDVLPSTYYSQCFVVKEKCDYVKRMCKPESNTSYFEPLTIENDIIPVINVIYDSIKQLTNNVEQKIVLYETKLSQTALCLDKSSIQNYIISLDTELEKRYPSAVEKGTYDNGETYRYSLIYQCLVYFNAHFAKETQEKYDVFLDYITNELKIIESDLQQMKYNEDNYFSLLHNSRFAADCCYEKQKMEYLLYSSEKSFTEEYIGDDTPSNALWGIRCFRLLIPYINEFIPVDVSVSDKELYCQYVAAKYLSNIN
jgi:hypothetical protein